jgi:predicted nucleic acid-binding protein
MKQSVYLETTIVSYLASKPSRDLIIAAHQQVTHECWQRRRNAFEVFVSELVIAEASVGDPEAVQRRQTILQGLPLLDITPSVSDLANHIATAVRLPSRAAADAVHIATAACNGIQFLLTWNSKHIANAELRPRVERTCRALGYEPPVLCTPDELMGGA